jgi:hypothetical protein
MKGWELEAIRSVPCGREYKNNFQKIAVVGGSWWLSLEMELITLFLAWGADFSRPDL